MKPLDFEVIERVARMPEGRPQVERLRELAQTGLDSANDGLAAAKRALAQAEDNVRFFQRDVEGATATANRFQGDVDRLEKLLRESAGERNL